MELFLEYRNLPGVLSVVLEGGGLDDDIPLAFDEWQLGTNWPFKMKVTNIYGDVPLIGKIWHYTQCTIAWILVYFEQELWR